MDHTSHRQPVRCHPDPEHQLYWSLVWLRSGIPMGIWLYQISCSAREDLALHRRQAQPLGPHTALRLRRPEDLWKIRRIALNLDLAKISAHSRKSYRANAYLCCRHTKARSMSIRPGLPSNVSKS